MFKSFLTSATAKKMAIGTAITAMAFPALADDQTAAIAALSATAETNQGAIIAAVISLAAISFGVGYLLKWLSK